MNPSLTLATWNVNSINARLLVVLRWLREAAPDVVLVQETKTINEAFPAMEIEDLGYNVLLHGQKTYNGVAIFSKFPIEEVTRTLPGMEDDPQARYIEAILSLPGHALRVASVYVPNGESPESDKFAYKMRFYDALRAHAASWTDPDEAVVLGGDFNCGPYPMDVYAPAQLDGTVCYHPRERAQLRALMHENGLYDAFRAMHPDAHAYSWWDYRGGGFDQNKGFRIDHLLLNAPAMDRLQSATIDPTPRGWEKPSDHTPVLATLRIK